MTNGGWIAEAVRAATLERVAGDLGLAIRRKHLPACPACNVEKHGSGKVYRGDTGDRWHCHRCGADGDALALVAFHLFGAPASNPDQWRQVREWFEGRGYVSKNGPRIAHKAVSSVSRTQPPPQEPQGVEPPAWPPTDDLKSLWGQGQPFEAMNDGHRWAGRFGIPHEVVNALNLARVFPESAKLPGWARCAGHSWREGWRLLLPMYGPEGRCVSMAARWVSDGDPPKGAKECTPAGFSRSGAVYADPMGLALLQGNTEEGGCRWNGGVVIAEGGKDYLTWAARAGRVTPSDDGPETFAVLGVWAGAWSAEIAARIPDGARVTIRTDQNEAGDKYAETIAETLHGRCVVKRPNRKEYAQ